MIVHIEGFSDPRLADYRNVPDAELLRARGIFVAEGRLVVRRLLASPRFQTRSVLLTATAYEALADAIEPFPDLPVYVVAQETMNAVAGFNIHRGCLAVGERPPACPWTDVTRDASLVVALERVSNADNVGGICRSAEAFGADAVLLGPACADPLYRKAIRTSMGSAFRVPFAALTAWADDLVRLRAAGFQLLALTPAPEAIALRDIPASDRVALLVGHEGEGLSDDALAAATVRARIPMTRGVDSLNVASAASIALYELSSRRIPPERAGRGTADRCDRDPTSDPPAGT